MGPGTRLCSDVFEVGGQLFRLEVYPAGLNADTHKYVSLFLTTPGAARPNYLLYELSIVDKSRSRPQHITEARTAGSASPPEPAAITAPQPGVVAGFPKFIRSSFLHQNAQRFLPEDTLTVRATIKVLTSWRSAPSPHTTQPLLFSAQPPPAAAAPPQHCAPLPAGHAPAAQPALCVGGAGFNPVQTGLQCGPPAAPPSWALQALPQAAPCYSGGGGASARSTVGTGSCSCGCQRYTGNCNCSRYSLAT